MFSHLVREMNNATTIQTINTHTKKEEIPGWLLPSNA